MSRDPAQRVINWFAWLMVAVFIASCACVGMAGWGLWELVAYLRG